jgi:hypothetical protein
VASNFKDEAKQETGMKHVAGFAGGYEEFHRPGNEAEIFLLPASCWCVPWLILRP